MDSLAIIHADAFDRSEIIMTAVCSGMLAALVVGGLLTLRRILIELFTPKD
jgi:hypothetical protein